MESKVEDLFDKGLTCFNTDLYDEAIKIFTKVLIMNPDHPDALYYRALAWAIKRDFDRAIVDFTKASEKHPNDSDTLIGRGEAWQGKGKLKRALADFKKALSIDPDNPDYQKLVDDLEEK